MGLFRSKNKDANKEQSDQELSPSVSQAGGSDHEKNAPHIGENDPLARLETSQRAALLAQIETPYKKSVSYLGLMRYASKTDRILQCIGIVTCIAAGAALVRIFLVPASWRQPADVEFSLS